MQFNKIIFFIFLTSFQLVCSQELYLKIKTKDTSNFKVIQSLKYRHFIKKKDIPKELDSINKQLAFLGYLNHQISTRKKIDSIYLVTYNLKNLLKEIHLKVVISPILKEFLNKNNLEFEKDSLKIPFNSIRSFQQKLVSFYENKGYSFTETQLKNIHFYNDFTKAELTIRQGKYRTIDKYVIKGYKKFPKKYIERVFDNQNNTFNKHTISLLSKKIRTIPFVETIKKPQVLFLKDSTLIYIYLKKKKNNQFDGVLGFASDSKGKIVFNGYLNLALQNIFNGGEQLQLQWKSNEKQNKQIIFAMEIPYVFKSAISPKLQFSIFSQDSTFVNTKFQTAINYQISYSTKMGLVVQTEKSTNLLKETSVGIQDYNSLLYGLNYEYQKPSDDFFYSNRFEIQAMVLIGHQKLQESQNEKTKLQTELNYLWTLTKHHKLFFKNTNAFNFPKKYFLNELEQIGGNRSLRGFNENSIPVSNYSIFTAEYNYLLNNKTAVYTIADYAYLKNDVDNHIFSTLSLGLGYKAKLKSSILNISYAVGKFNQTAFQFKQATFNVSYVNYF